MTVRVGMTHTVLLFTHTVLLFTSWLTIAARVLGADATPQEVGNTTTAGKASQSVSTEIDIAHVTTSPIGNPMPLRPIVCTDGVLHYEDGGEVALWGASLQTSISWEYRTVLQRVGVPLEAGTLKQITDENLEQLRRMRVGVLRVHLLPGDFTDAQGGVVDTVFLDQLDYLIARCHEYGIYVYLTLINEMGPPFLADSFLSRWSNPKTCRVALIADEACVRLCHRYVRNLLNRKNRYTHVRLADEPAIAVLEILNEPAYQPQEPTRYATVKRYINGMYDAIRATGAKQPVVWNLNWPAMIVRHDDVFQAAADSRVEGVSFCCYPGQESVENPFWAHPADLTGKNFLPRLADFYANHDWLRWALAGRFAGKAKLVYEFETMYNQSSYLYPAMARLFRALGAQVACMWTYRLSPAAKSIGGSHYLNLLTTPEKAVSFLIAGEVMVRTPRYARYDTTAKDTMSFGSCYLSYPDNVSAFCAGGRVMYSRSIAKFPFSLPSRVTEIIGTESSPLVSYEGTGAYFIEITDKTIELHVGPNVTRLRDVWNNQKGRPKPICRLDRQTANRMTLHLPGWDEQVSVFRIDGKEERPVASVPGPSFEVTAGRYRIENRPSDAGGSRKLSFGSVIGGIK